LKCRIPKFILSLPYISSFNQGFNHNHHFCPSCTGRLYRHGTRLRHVIEEGLKIWHKVQRCRCLACKRACTFLPTTMVPHKHYPAAEVEAVVSSASEGRSYRLPGLGAEESTLKRWIKAFWLESAALTGHLEALLMIISPSRLKVSLCRPVHNPYERLKDALLPFVPTCHEGEVLSRAFFIRRFHPVCVC
jgi:hypothetical protein